MAKDAKVIAPIEISFKHERDTKGAARYYEVDDAGNQKTSDYIVGTMYIRKSGLPNGIPEAFDLVIKPKAA